MTECSFRRWGTLPTPACSVLGWFLWQVSSLGPNPSSVTVPGAPHDPGFSPTGISRSGVLAWVELFSESFSANICSVPTPSLCGPVQECQEHPVFQKYKNLQHLPALTLATEHSASATKTQAPPRRGDSESVLGKRRESHEWRCRMDIVTSKSNTHSEQDLTSQRQSTGLVNLPESKRGFNSPLFDPWGSRLAPALPPWLQHSWFLSVGINTHFFLCAFWLQQTLNPRMLLFLQVIAKTATRSRSLMALLEGEATLSFPCTTIFL